MARTIFLTETTNPMIATQNPQLPSSGSTGGQSLAGLHSRVTDGD